MEESPEHIDDMDANKYSTSEEESMPKEKLSSSHMDSSRNSSNGENEVEEMYQFSLEEDSENLLVVTKEKLVCTVCNRKCNNKNSLVVHMRLHTGEKPFECTLCESKFTQKANLDVHMQKHRSSAKWPKKKSKVFKCKDCGFASQQRGNLDAHVRIHTGEKPFMCKYCDQKFKQLSHLQVHERRHTGEKPFVCVICSCAFAQKSNLLSHLKVHN